MFEYIVSQIQFYLSIYKLYLFIKETIVKTPRENPSIIMNYL
jgi:hypothetical protein